jgi:hypothetical protein
MNAAAPAAGSQWVESLDTFPFDNSPTSWTDLDLSGSIPEGGPVWVLLQFVAGGWNYVRPNGSTTDVWQGGNTGWGAATLLCRTDADCVVEWKAETTAGQTVTLIGYVTDIVVPTLTLHDGDVAAGDTALDASDEIDDFAIVQLKLLQKKSMGSVWQDLRPHGDEGTWTVQNANSWAPASAGYPNADASAQGLITKTGDAGEIDLWASAEGSRAKITLDSFVQAGFKLPAAGQEIVFAYGVTPAAYADLDLSAAIGKQKSLVFLKVRVQNATYATFRKNGSTTLMSLLWGGMNFARFADGDNNHCGVVIVACDAAGVVEWQGDGSAAVTVLGYIPEA